MQSEKKREACRSWVVFWLGMALVPIGFVLWTAMTGVAYWLSPNRALAARVLWAFLILAGVLCVAAPWLRRGSNLRRGAFSLLSAAAVVVLYYLCGAVHFLLYGA